MPRQLPAEFSYKETRRGGGGNAYMLLFVLSGHFFHRNLIQIAAPKEIISVITNNRDVNFIRNDDRRFIKLFILLGWTLLFVQIELDPHDHLIAVRNLDR